MCFYLPIAKLTSVNGSSYYRGWPQNSSVYSVYPRGMSNLYMTYSGGKK